MQRKSFGSMSCPIARSLERVGEWWSILILRDAFRGLTRFDQFQKSLGIAPNMLTRRLNALVESGLLERRAYSEHPPRYEYVLTERGRDFRPVLWALLAWGNKPLRPRRPERRRRGHRDRRDRPTRSWSIGTPAACWSSRPSAPPPPGARHERPGQIAERDIVARAAAARTRPCRASSLRSRRRRAR